MVKWNKYHEHLLKKWSEMSKTYCIMHSIAARYYSEWEKRFGIPTVLLGALTSSSIFSTVNVNNNLWTYINGALVLTMTGLTGISRFLGTREKQIKHTNASFEYTKISMDIDTILSFPKAERDVEPQKFINQTKLMILKVREQSPDLPTWVVSTYIRKLDKSITYTKTKVNSRKTQARDLPIEAYSKLRNLMVTDDGRRSMPQEKTSESGSKTSEEEKKSSEENKKSNSVVINVRGEIDSDSEENIKNQRLMINQNEMVIMEQVSNRLKLNSSDTEITESEEE